MKILFVMLQVKAAQVKSYGQQLPSMVKLTHSASTTEDCRCLDQMSDILAR